jgi:hypothetical protein
MQETGVLFRMWYFMFYHVGSSIYHVAEVSYMMDWFA